MPTPKKTAEGTWRVHVQVNGEWVVAVFQDLLDGASILNSSG